jgi:hypothetical protein
MRCNIEKVIMDNEARKTHLHNMMDLCGFSGSEISRIISEYKEHLRRAEQIGMITEKNATKTSDVLDNIMSIYSKTGIFESPICCYSGLALTNVPEDKKIYVQDQHHAIKEAVLKSGLINYDPAEAPFNPQEFAIGEPKDIYKLDALMVLASKIFTFSSLSASTGGGIEVGSAMYLNKLPFILCKKGDKNSRMLTGTDRTIVVECEDFIRQQDEIVDLLGEFKDYELGVGYCNKHGNSLLGFKDENVYCLHGEFEEKFPKLVYQYNK